MQACDLLDRAPPGAAGRDAVTMIFCWLRYSLICQLSWQRNYKTKLTYADVCRRVPTCADVCLSWQRTFKTTTNVCLLPVLLQMCPHTRTTVCVFLYYYMCVLRYSQIRQLSWQRNYNTKVTYADVC